MDVLALFLSGFQEFSVGHIALAIYLYVIMDERGCRMLKKLPALAFSPALASMIHLSLYNVFKVSGLVLYVVISVANVLMCTLWVRWGWRIGIWRALAAVCMAGVFQVAISTLSWMLLQTIPLEQVSRFLVAEAVFGAVVLAIVFLLYRLRFGRWFRLLMEDGPGRRRTALLLLALECSMELLLMMQSGLQPDPLPARRLRPEGLQPLTGRPGPVLRQADLHIGECLGQTGGQRGAHHIFCGEVSGVQQVQAQGLGVQESVVFHVGGDEGVAALGHGVLHHGAAGAAPHRHPLDGPSSVHEPDAGGAQLLLHKGGVLPGGQPGPVDRSHPADAVGAALGVHPRLLELADLCQLQRLGQAVVDPAQGGVQVGVGTDDRDPELRIAGLCCSHQSHTRRQRDKFRLRRVP